MEDDTPIGTEKKFIIRLTGLQPGASKETLIQALQRIFKGKNAEEIGKALERLPLGLSRSLAEDKARQIKLFLESQGAVLGPAGQTGGARRGEGARAPSPKRGASDEDARRGGILRGRRSR